MSYTDASAMTNSRTPAKLGANEKALKYCDDILSMKNIPKKTLDELNGRLERVKSLKMELSKKS